MTSPARGERKPYPSDTRRLPLSGVCRICGEAEPFHIHDGDRRIDDYFTVGRGQTDFDAARAWKSRAVKAEAALATARRVDEATIKRVREIAEEAVSRLRRKRSASGFTFPVSNMIADDLDQRLRAVLESA